MQIQLAKNYWLIGAFVRWVLVTDKVFSTVNKSLVGVSQTSASAPQVRIRIKCSCQASWLKFRSVTDGLAYTLWSARTCKYFRVTMSHLQKTSQSVVGLGELYLLALLLLESWEINKNTGVLGWWYHYILCSFLLYISKRLRVKRRKILVLLGKLLIAQAP